MQLFKDLKEKKKRGVKGLPKLRPKIRHMYCFCTEETHVDDLD